MEMRQVNNHKVYRANRNRVFQYILRHDLTTRSEIAHALNLSMPTIINIVKSLMDDGLVYEAGAAQSNGGRKAVTLSCNTRARVSVGMDITLHHISVVFVDIKGAVILKEKTVRPFERSGEYYAFLARLIDRCMLSHDIDPALILGVGISVPGRLSGDSRTLLYSHVLNESNMLCSELESCIPFPCRFCNDANAAALAELWNNHSIGTAVYLSVSDSVGGAVIINDVLYTGENQLAGEFGHMTLVEDGKPCYCGKRGCADAYCAASSLSALAEGKLDAFFSLLRQNHAPATQAWQAYLANLSILINNLRMAFDCPVILGGYIGEYIEPYIDALREMAGRRNTFFADASYIRAATFQHEPSAVGAALLFIEPFIAQI
ncbi:MAG: ROK family transcriptional regulator [Eubacteriales bacterium]|nr:ROK family transcriptional regulator [Eubacteriales bacterium]